jgi:hypothetical protein
VVWPHVDLAACGGTTGRRQARAEAAPRRQVALPLLRAGAGTPCRGWGPGDLERDEPPRAGVAEAAHFPRLELPPRGRSRQQQHFNTYGENVDYQTISGDYIPLIDKIHINRPLNLAYSQSPAPQVVRGWVWTRSHWNIEKYKKGCINLAGHGDDPRWRSCAALFPVSARDDLHERGHARGPHH